MKLEFLESEWQELIENCAFTDDELEIIPYLKRGLYLYSIAQRLNVSEKTVQRRRKSIETKMIKYLRRVG